MHFPSVEAPSAARRLEPLDRWAAGAAVLLFVAIALLDHAYSDDPAVAHLYYLPILLAGTRLGSRPALAFALGSIVSFHWADPDRAALRYGEEDFVQLSLFVLVAVVASRLADQAREMRHLASTDDLTGLHNLRSFARHLIRALSDPIRVPAPATMLGLDVDHLKEVNDRYGHLAGGDVVRHVGRLVAEHVPERAVACRYGGDEFAVFIPRCDAAEGTRIAEDLCRAVRESAPVLDGRPFVRGTVSVSIGLAVSVPARGADPAAGARALFAAADRALYAAKHAGRAAVAVAESTPVAAGAPAGAASR